jgi:hypothetical protein
MRMKLVGIGLEDVAMGAVVCKVSSWPRWFDAGMADAVVFPVLQIAAIRGLGRHFDNCPGILWVEYIFRTVDATGGL